MMCEEVGVVGWGGEGREKIGKYSVFLVGGVSLWLGKVDKLGIGS